MVNGVFVSVLVVAILGVRVAVEGSQALRPVVLVPGFLSSVLERSVDAEQTKWETAWFNLALIIEMGPTNYFEAMKLNYDPVNDLYSNTSAFKIRPVDFGGVDGIRKLDTGLLGALSVQYDSFIKALQKAEPGYLVGLNLAGAPYDWRIPTWHPQQQAWVDGVRNLIETMVNESAGNPKAVIVAHSMGGVGATMFLNAQPQWWKDQYVDTLVILGAPLGGAPFALEAVASGIDFKADFFRIFPYQKMRDWARSWPASAALLPNMDYGQPLAVVAGKEYYVSDLDTLLQMSGATSTLEMMKGVYLSSAPESPGVPVQCHAGISLPTATTFKWDKQDFSVPPSYLSTDGDGSVPLLSVARCKDWAASTPVSFITHEKVTHPALITKPEVFNPIIKEVILRP